jgi:hypothetical protein
MGVSEEFFVTIEGVTKNSSFFGLPCSNRLEMNTNIGSFKAFY